MSDQRNLVLAIAVSIAIVLGWQVFLAPKDVKPPAPAPQTTQPGAQPGAPTAPGAPVATGAPSAPGAPGAPAPTAPGAKPTDRVEMLKRSPRIAIDTPELTGSIALKGGRLDDIQLKNHRETADRNSPPITLLSPEGAPHAYFIDYGWAAADKSLKLPDRETQWTADRDKLTPSQPVTLSWNNGAGVTFALRYEIDANFMVTVTQKVANAGQAAITLFPYGLVSRHGKPETQGLFILHEGPYGVFDGTQKELSYSDMKDKPLQNFPTTGGWIGFTDKYWMATLVPDQKNPVDARFLYTVVDNIERYQADYTGKAQTVAPGATLDTLNRAYTGAKIVNIINEYRENPGIVRFDLVTDWGWFFFFTKPLHWLLDHLFRLIGNFGLAIMALTVLVKLGMFPLANKSYQSMSKMKALGPQMAKLKERFGDDRQKLNQEMMALYKKEKINPAAGCLPIVVQIPVFFALYKVLYVTIEMRHQPFFGWITDLSAPDPATILTGFGLINWHVPEILSFINIGIWPLIMGFTMWAQQRLNPQPTDPMQARIFAWMPIVFTFILAPFAAGLVIYWAWNNTLSILQQYIIMRRMGVHVDGTTDPGTAAAAVAKKPTQKQLKKAGKKD